MKHYFKFNLTGQKLLPVWLSFVVLFIAPYLLILYKLIKIHPGDQKNSLIVAAVIFGLVLVAFGLSFFIEKLIIEHIEHKDTGLVFKGKLWKFMGIISLGAFLSIITFGFYLPWFIKNIQKFFVDNSIYNSQNPKFQGGGGSLFVILTLTLIMPLVTVSLLWGLFTAANYHLMPVIYKVIYQTFLIITIIPYIYFIYKWAVEIELNDYTVSWETNFWKSSAKILSQIFLSIITLGIYSPLATLQLYKYFAERTIARSEVGYKNFGYEIEPLDDFLFIWGQMLLSVITLGIYFPWAFCKIRSRIFSKTYSEEIKLA